MFIPLSHQSNSSQSVANSMTFSQKTTSYRWTSTAAMMSKAVARVRSNVSELAAPSRSRAICPRVRFLPPHGAISVQIGEPHRTRVRGRRRFS